MMRRDAGRFNRLLGLMYIVFQIGGGIAGSLLAYNIFLKRTNIGIIKDSGYWSQAMAQETLGSLLFVFVYLS